MKRILAYLLDAAKAFLHQMFCGRSEPEDIWHE